MKNNKNFIFCLFLGLAISSGIILAEKNIAITNPDYLPITEYQSSLSKMITRLMSVFSYQKKDPVKKLSKVLESKKEEEKKVSRLDAIEKIRHITTKLFDDADVNHITYYLTRMKDLTKYLDPVEDKKLIAAINFLLANHHRSSITDTLFWMKAVRELELDTIIPMTPETAAKNKATKMKTLNKKMLVGN